MQSPYKKFLPVNCQLLYYYITGIDAAFYLLQFLQVRDSVCLVGFNREALQGTKLKISSLLTDPIPLESFHVKKLSDIRDGALLVPKIIFIVVHCPGKKVLDEDGNEGQLDHLYDEACEIGGNMFIAFYVLFRLSLSLEMLWCTGQRVCTNMLLLNRKDVLQNYAYCELNK